MFPDNGPGFGIVGNVGSSHSYKATAQISIVLFAGLRTGCVFLDAQLQGFLRSILAPGYGCGATTLPLPIPFVSL